MDEVPEVWRGVQAPWKPPPEHMGPSEALVDEAIDEVDVKIGKRRGRSKRKRYISQAFIRNRQLRDAFNQRMRRAPTTSARAAVELEEWANDNGMGAFEEHQEWPTGDSAPVEETETETGRSLEELPLRSTALLQREMVQNPKISNLVRLLNENDCHDHNEQDAAQMEDVPEAGKLTMDEIYNEPWNSVGYRVVIDSAALPDEVRRYKCAGEDCSDLIIIKSSGRITAVPAIPEWEKSGPAARRRDAHFVVEIDRTQARIGGRLLPPERKRPHRETIQLLDLQYKDDAGKGVWRIANEQLPGGSDHMLGGLPLAFGFECRKCATRKAEAEKKLTHAEQHRHCDEKGLLTAIREAKKKGVATGRVAQAEEVLMRLRILGTELARKLMALEQQLACPVHNVTALEAHSFAALEVAVKTACEAAAAAAEVEVAAYNAATAAGWSSEAGAAAAEAAVKAAGNRATPEAAVTAGATAGKAYEEQKAAGKSPELAPAPRTLEAVRRHHSTAQFVLERAQQAVRRKRRLLEQRQKVAELAEARSAAKAAFDECAGRSSRPLRTVDGKRLKKAADVAKSAHEGADNVLQEYNTAEASENRARARAQTEAEKQREVGRHEACRGSVLGFGPQDRQAKRCSTCGTGRGGNISSLFGHADIRSTRHVALPPYEPPDGEQQDGEIDDPTDPEYEKSDSESDDDSNYSDDDDATNTTQRRNAPSSTGRGGGGSGKSGANENHDGQGRRHVPLTGIGPMGKKAGVNEAAFKEAIDSGAFIQEQSGFTHGGPASGHMILIGTLDLLSNAFATLFAKQNVTALPRMDIGSIIRGLLDEEERELNSPLPTAPPVSDYHPHENVFMCTCISPSHCHLHHTTITPTPCPSHPGHPPSQPSPSPALADMYGLWARAGLVKLAKTSEAEPSEEEEEGGKKSDTYAVLPPKNGAAVGTMSVYTDMESLPQVGEDDVIKQMMFPPAPEVWRHPDTNLATQKRINRTAQVCTTP